MLALILLKQYINRWKVFLQTCCLCAGYIFVSTSFLFLRERPESHFLTFSNQSFPYRKWFMIMLTFILCHFVRWASNSWSSNGTNKWIIVLGIYGTFVYISSLCMCERPYVSGCPWLNDTTYCLTHTQLSVPAHLKKQHCDRANTEPAVSLCWEWTYTQLHV